MPPNYQIQNYSHHFLLSAGGRFISLIVYTLALWSIVFLLIKVVTWEPLLNRLEDLHEYFQFQVFIRIYQTMFLDLLLSNILTLHVFQTNSSIALASSIVAILFILITTLLIALLIKFIIINPQAVKLPWIHKYIPCIYDSYHLRSLLGRLFILLPYLQKLIIAIILVIVTNPLIQIIIIALTLLIHYPPLFKFNPYINQLLLIRFAINDLITTATILTSLVFLSYYDTK